MLRTFIAFLLILGLPLTTLAEDQQLSGSSSVPAQTIAQPVVPPPAASATTSKSGDDPEAQAEQQAVDSTTAGIAPIPANKPTAEAQKKEADKQIQAPAAQPDNTVQPAVSAKKKSAARTKHSSKKTADKSHQQAATKQTQKKDASGRFESVLTRNMQGSAQNDQALLSMLNSQIDLQQSLKEQINTVTKKLKRTSAESEKINLQQDLSNLNKQLNETGLDFERLATGVNPSIFSDKQDNSFSWKAELMSLLEPTVRELKQLTAKARHKADLKDAIETYQKQVSTAQSAIDRINSLIDNAKDSQLKSYLNDLLPAWENMQQRISGKLDLAQQELDKVNASEVPLSQRSSHSIRNFFKDRGWYLLLAAVTFAGILLAFRILTRILFWMLPGARKEHMPAYVRILYVGLRIISATSAVIGFVMVLYLAEDWFLLSGAIIFFLGLAWTLRQTLPKLWKQMLLMMNMGPVREGERIIYQGVPWKVESINVFCKLHNPALGMRLRMPIETLVGLTSRHYEQNEPWFPCKVGDWVAIEGKANAKVVSATHEMVELVELGGHRTIYQTSAFLGLSPANLSTNFLIRVVFGLSYNLQAEITTTVLQILHGYLHQKFEEHGYTDDCLSLKVDFLQAGASSLDVVIFATMKGSRAPAFNYMQRDINRWCVECANINNWEIPFPQLTVHMPDAGK